MKAPLRILASLVASSIGLGSLLAADWPGFRGPKGDGIALDKDLPSQLTKDNLLWKVKLPGVGTSSPITVGDKVFLTGYSGYGTTITKGFSGGGGFPKGGKGGKGKGGPDTGGDQKKLTLLLICMGQAKGQVVWQKEIAPKLPEAPFTGFLRDHGYASSTPVSDGESTFVFFGKSGVLAFDMEGKQLWRSDVGSGTHMWGSAASPILYKDLLIVNAAIESKSLVAFDKKTGKELWRTSGIGTSWGSPLLVETKEGKQELVLSVPGKVVGYDPETGKELWHCQGIGGGGGGKNFGGGGFGGGGFGGSYTCSTPVARDGVVYVMGGGGPTSPTTLAVKAGGRGDVDKTHVLWRQKTGSGTCSPVLSGDQFCFISGTAIALNLSDGKTTYNERLYGSRSEYVSAVAADDKIYALTRSDGLYVISGGDKFQKLAHYEFEGDTSIFNASPAISNGKIFIRSNAYLYCLGKSADR